MPSTSRGRNAATAVAVVLAVLLAVVWLRASGDAAPSVPVGLPVETVPATVEAPAEPVGLGQGGRAEAEEASRVGGDERPGDPVARERGRHARRRGELRRDAAGGWRRDGRRPASEQPRRREHADRAGGDEDARARRKPRARGRVGPIRQDPPATAPAPEVGSTPAPKVGSGTVRGGSPPASGGGASPARPAPEFAIG